MSRFQLNLLTLCLAFVVITLGAFVRLSDAGLGCPDWPGCYGHLDVPTEAADVAAANARFSERPVEAPKAWKEMIHRYAAGALGLLILLMALAALRRSGDPHQQRVLPWVLLVLVIFQALLGMWTVTLLLKPLIVTAHLLGGMATFALLGWCLFRAGPLFAGWAATARRGLRVAAAAALVLPSGRYSSAPGRRPTTPRSPVGFSDLSDLLVAADGFLPAFTLWHGLGINYEYGGGEHAAGDDPLDASPRCDVIAIVMLALAAGLWRAGRVDGRWRGLVGTLAAALALQVALGISVVEFHLPLSVAVAHNGGAALLLLTLVAINHAVWSARRHV